MRTRFFIIVVGLSALVLSGPALSQSFVPPQVPAENPSPPAQRGKRVPASSDSSPLAAMVRTMRAQAKAQLDMLELQKKQTEEQASEQVKQIMEDAHRQIEQVKQQSRRLIEQLEAQRKLFQAQADRQIEELKLQAKMQGTSVEPVQPSIPGPLPTPNGKSLLDRLEKLEKRLDKLERKPPR